MMKRGFTLFEVLIAISILGTVSYLSYFSMSGMFEMKEDVNMEQQYIQRLNRNIQRMQREIGNAFILASYKEDARVITLFEGKQEFDIDRITFMSFSHLRVHFNGKDSDQSEITYWGERDNSQPGYRLMRRETNRIDEFPNKGGAVHMIADRVKEFHCTYYKKESEEWISEWNTQGVELGRKLPRYIRCELIILPPFGEDEESREEHYRFAITVPLTEGLK